MTHDELLAKIGENAHLPKQDLCSCGEKIEGFEHHLNDIVIKKDNALRVVVELHKPMLTGKWCKGCSQSSSEFTPKLVHHMEFAAAVYVAFPCPTIQAIQKELE